MATATGSVDGWRTRALQRWYPTNGSWVACSNKITGVAINASSPINITTGETTDNMYTTCIKVTTPDSSDIGAITSITVTFMTYNRKDNVGTLYGSLRTVDPATGTSTSDTLDTYRTNIAGGSSEQSCSPLNNASVALQYSMTFTGTFSKNTTYYLYLYTKNNAYIYTFSASSTGYTCSVEYSKAYTISFSSGAGSGSVPASITGYEGQEVTIGSVTPTPPANSSTTTTNITINAYNGSVLFGTHYAKKNEYTKYSFSNWQGGGWTVSAGGKITITGNITLTAQYSGSVVTTYSGNTINNVIASVGTPSKSYANVNIPVLLDASTNGGTTATTKLNAIQSGTYTFLGWNTDANASVALSDSTSYTSNTSLYAIYSLETSIGSVTLPITGVSKNPDTAATYTITLNPGSGTVSPTSVTATKVKSYKFLGWATSANSATYITTYTPTGSNQTVYAIFDSGTISDNPATLPVPTRGGYAFLGWGLVSNATSYVNMKYMPTQNITLYAAYKISYSGEVYIWNNGAWRRALPHLRYQSVFNSCTNNT